MEMIVDVLTNIENDILNLMAEGLTNAEIASKLNISLDTVKTNVSSIYNKLEVKNRVQACVKAMNFSYSDKI